MRSNDRRSGESRTENTLIKSERTKQISSSVLCDDDNIKISFKFDFDELESALLQQLRVDVMNYLFLIINASLLITGLSSKNSSSSEVNETIVNCRTSNVKTMELALELRLADVI